MLFNLISQKLLFDIRKTLKHKHITKVWMNGLGSISARNFLTFGTKTKLKIWFWNSRFFLPVFFFQNLASTSIFVKKMTETSRQIKNLRTLSSHEYNAKVKQVGTQE